MDIWRWVNGREEALREDGHIELADHIDDISTHTVNDEFDLVDQIYHAALPLSRALDDKWLEIYFRHWRLQAHVLKNYDAKGLLNEAISLLDFAHSEETKNCPQRICTVQDLAACYGIKDGPGYAEERIAVCKETLAQIDGSWPCYQCVSSELLDALIDKEDYAQAEAELGVVDAEISKFQGLDDYELVLVRTRMLLGKGEFEAAWDIIKEAKNPEGGEGFIRHVELLKALTLCHLERWEEAHKTCLPFDDIVLAATYYKDWTKIQIQLERQGLVKNDREFRYIFHSLADKLVGKDALRFAFEICERLIELCIRANEKLRADYVIQMMENLIDRLHRDLGASDTLANLKSRVTKMKEPKTSDSFETADALLEHQFETETQEFFAIANALKQWPNDGRLYARKSDLFQSHFQKDAAYNFLETAYKDHRGSAALESRYGEAFLSKHGFETYQAEFPIDQLEGLSLGAIWNRGFKHAGHFESRDPEKTLEILKIIESYWPEDVSLLGRIARQEIELENYNAAIAYRRKQIKLDPENGNHKWDLLIAGTLTQNTPLILEMAELLNIDLDQDGLFPAESQENIRLQWKLKNGLIETYHAVRLGPALARITTICRVNFEHQPHGQHVVFDPAPLNKLDQKDDEGYACDIDGNYSLLYPPPIRILKDPNFQTYTIDGIHPGEEALQILSEKIQAAGYIYHVWSTDSYKLTWTDKGEERTDPAIYIYCLIPSGEENKLNNIFSEFNRGLEHPFVWVELAKALKDETLLLQQSTIIEKYGIED